MTKPKRYKRYSSEFKREATPRVSEESVTDAAISAEPGISTRQFRRWRDELQLSGNDAFPGQGRTRDQELTDLKRELAKVKQERDFLKEAATGWNRQRDGSSDECHNLPGSTPAVVLKAKLVYTLRLLIRGTDVCYFASSQPD